MSQSRLTIKEFNSVFINNQILTANTGGTLYVDNLSVGGGGPKIINLTGNYNSRVSDSGNIFVLKNMLTVNLPNTTDGTFSYKFIYGQGNTGGSIIQTVNDTGVNGFIINNGTFNNGNGGTMTFNTSAAAGDFIEVTCNGVDNIYAYAISAVTNGINFQ